MLFLYATDIICLSTACEWCFWRSLGPSTFIHWKSGKAILCLQTLQCERNYVVGTDYTASTVKYLCNNELFIIEIIVYDISKVRIQVFYVHQEGATERSSSRRNKNVILVV